MKIDGQCHCGEIAYEAELDLEKVAICHCTDCQALSASAFRTVAVVSGDTFQITKGAPKKYVKLGDSGNPRIQAFCPNCGSALYASDVSDTPAAYNLRAGTIRQRADLVPKVEYWRQSALPWLPENKGTRKFDQNPK
ncbi:MAG: GFA family protein [Alphaproteobacteria bacterium]|nr:GFA family protein [Alphaproteobacteria bacterium]